jgi:hypothetical protein
MQDNVVYTPGRANYTVNNTSVNHVYTWCVTRELIDRLINLALTTHDSSVIVPGFCLNDSFAYGTTANRSAAALAIYRDNNMIIFDAMMSWLDGEFRASLATLDTTNNLVGTPSFVLAWQEQVVMLVNRV